MTTNAPGVAISQEEAKKIIPRAEFRVFGRDVIAGVEETIWSTGAKLYGKRVMKPETYILSKNTCKANVKIRGGLLDIKVKTGETPEGFEIFAPRGKFAFPAKPEDLKCIFDALEVKVVIPAGETSYEDFEKIVRANPDLSIVTIDKIRYGFSIGDVICEYAKVWFNGALVETACCESENYAAIAAAAKALGIDGRPNTSYIKAAKKVIGWS